LEQPRYIQACSEESTSRRNPQGPEVPGRKQAIGLWKEAVISDPCFIPRDSRGDSRQQPPTQEELGDTPRGIIVFNGSNFGFLTTLPSSISTG
jgi:hypothetical protein